MVAQVNRKNISSLKVHAYKTYLQISATTTTYNIWLHVNYIHTLQHIPTPKNQLIPQWSYLQEFRDKDSEYKAKRRRDYNDKHRIRPQDPLLPDTSVWIKTEWSQTTGHIQSSA